MTTIRIISASVREGRNSHRIAMFFASYLQQNGITVEILDLKKYSFPLFHERLQFMKEPPVDVLEFSEKVSSADGIIIVTPEYNGGYPAALKNVVDLLYREWKKKPILISTVSDGSFGGSQVITSLLFTLWKIGAWIVPAMFPVQNVEESYNEDGVPADKTTAEKRARHFIGELLWAVEAKKKMEEGANTVTTKNKS